MSQRPAGLFTILPLYAALAVATGFVDSRARAFPERGQEYVQSVLDGTAEAPGRYRVLAPAVYAGFQRISGLDAADAWTVFRWLCLFGCLIAGHYYLRIWFDTAEVVLGNGLVMALLPLTFTNSWGHPDHLLELLLFTAAATMVARERPLSFLVVLTLAALNRETSAFLLILFALAPARTRTHLTWLIGSVLLWLGVFVGLRAGLGWVTYSPWHFPENLRLLFWWPPERDLYYRLYSWFFAVLTLPMAVLIAWSWSRQPRFFRVAAGVVAPVVLIVGALFSSIIEPRIFTPVIPMLVPPTILALRPLRPAIIEPAAPGS